MNKWIFKILILIAYCIPYAYLAINADVSNDSMFFYVVMAIALACLTLVSIKTRNILALIIGNILSFITSYLLIINTENNDWARYLKPFNGVSLLIFISLLAFIFQLLYATKSKYFQLRKLKDRT